MEQPQTEKMYLSRAQSDGQRQKHKHSKSWCRGNASCTDRYFWEQQVTSRWSILRQRECTNVDIAVKARDACKNIVKFGAKTMQVARERQVTGRWSILRLRTRTNVELKVKAEDRSKNVPKGKKYKWRFAEKSRNVGVVMQR